MEATLLGIPAIALSQAYGAARPRARSRWACARARTRPASSARCMAGGHPAGHAGQHQLPRLRARGGRGRRRRGAGPARRRTCSRIEERVDGRDNPYFWIGFAREPFTPGNGTDLAALADAADRRDAAAHRPDRRADADALRRACSTSAERGGRGMSVGPRITTARRGARSPSSWRCARKGLRDTDVLRAFETVPRSRFVPRRFVDLALTRRRAAHRLRPDHARALAAWPR